MRTRMLAVIAVASSVGSLATGCGASTTATRSGARPAPPASKTGTTTTESPETQARGPVAKAEEIITKAWFANEITEAQYHTKLQQIHAAVQRSYEEIKEKAER